MRRRGPAPEPRNPSRRVRSNQSDNTHRQEERTMRVNLSGHHVDVTPALRSYVERKLGRARRAAPPRRAALVPAL